MSREQQIPTDFSLKGYRFPLPSELIAQEPPARRGESRLLVLDRASGRLTVTRFAALADFAPPGLMVVNNSKVVPARVFGKRESGGRVEFLLTTPLPQVRAVAEENGLQCAKVTCLLRSSKKVRPGETVYLAEDFYAEVAAREDYGRCTAYLHWKGELPKRLHEAGVLPLPPYIRRPQSAADAERYQTVYAREDKSGSMAAPTAGLHFTADLRAELVRAGFKWAEVTLYVGYGTFSPVRCADIREHAMHAEYCEISAESAAAIAEAKQAGKAVTAVGTTSARALEGAFARNGVIAPFSGWTDIFLYPGRPIKVVDHLLTNFHLPESSLLMLVSAFAGRQRILDAYSRAVAERFRFFSYGDAMLIMYNLLTGRRPFRLPRQGA